MAHRRLHGTEHQNGSVDEINVGGLSGVLADRQDANKLQGRDVQDVGPNDGDVLTWDNTDNRWEPAAPTGGGGTFGADYQVASSEADSSSSLETWIEKLTLDTGVLTAGTYRIAWYYEIQTTSSSMTGFVRIQQDDIDTLGSIEVRVTPDSGWTSQSGFKHVTLTAAAHTFDVDYMVENGGKTMHIRRVRLEFWRVS